VADLFGATAISCIRAIGNIRAIGSIWAIGLSAFSAVGAALAGVEHLLAAAAAEI
jgi:hypothetical protein